MSDGFFFNVEKWFASISVQRMSFAERGVYLTMMFEQWRDASKSLPDDPQAVADMIAVTDAQAAEVVAAWPVVRPKFEPCKPPSTRIQNRVIEQTRRKQSENLRKRVEAGRMAGKASAAKRKTHQELVVNQSLTTVEQSSTDKIRLDQIRSEEIRSDQIAPARDARVNGSGKNFGRVHLHRWQIDALIDRLGELSETFALDEWLDGLNQKLAGKALPRDAWVWVQSEFQAEITRRNLPTVGASVDVNLELVRSLIERDGSRS